MTDAMIMSAERAAASLRARAARPTWAEVAKYSDRNLARPRRRRHRAVSIEYRLSPAEFIISGTACALLGGIGTMFLAAIMWGPWWA